MRDDLTGFEFEKGEVAGGSGEFIARVPKDVMSKRDLLRTLADELRFPRYFGQNWDALRDCLGDLGWLPEQTVVLVHEGIPIALGGSDLRIYLQILGESVHDWKERRTRGFRVIFPVETESIVHRTLLG